MITHEDKVVQPSNAQKQTSQQQYSNGAYFPNLEVSQLRDGIDDVKQKYEELKNNIDSNIEKFKNCRAEFTQMLSNISKKVAEAFPDITNVTVVQLENDISKLEGRIKSDSKILPKTAGLKEASQDYGSMLIEHEIKLNKAKLFDLIERKKIVERKIALKKTYDKIQIQYNKYSKAVDELHKLAESSELTQNVKSLEDNLNIIEQSQNPDRDILKQGIIGEPKNIKQLELALLDIKFNFKKMMHTVQGLGSACEDAKQQFELLAHHIAYQVHAARTGSQCENLHIRLNQCKDASHQISDVRDGKLFDKIQQTKENIKKLQEPTPDNQDEMKSKENKINQLTGEVDQLEKQLLQRYQRFDHLFDETFKASSSTHKWLEFIGIIMLIKKREQEMQAIVTQIQSGVYPKTKKAMTETHITRLKTDVIKLKDELSKRLKLLKCVSDTNLDLDLEKNYNLLSSFIMSTNKKITEESHPNLYQVVTKGGISDEIIKQINQIITNLHTITIYDTLLEKHNAFRASIEKNKNQQHKHLLADHYQHYRELSHVNNAVDDLSASKEASDFVHGIYGKDSATNSVIDTTYLAINFTEKANGQFHEDLDKLLTLLKQLKGVDYILPEKYTKEDECVKDMRIKTTNDICSIYNGLGIKEIITPKIIIDIINVINTNIALYVEHINQIDKNDM